MISLHWINCYFCDRKTVLEFDCPMRWCMCPSTVVGIFSRPWRVRAHSSRSKPNDKLICNVREIASHILPDFLCTFYRYFRRHCHSTVSSGPKNELSKLELLLRPKWNKYSPYWHRLRWSCHHYPNLSCLCYSNPSLSQLNHCQLWLLFVSSL